MKKIIEKVKSQIPKDSNGFFFRKSQCLYIPYMEIGVECLIRDISEINLFFETILKLIEIDVREIGEISNILGVTFDVVKEAVVDMVDGNYISVSENMLKITKKGAEALKTKQLVEIKKKNISKVMVDLITGEIYEGSNMKGCRVSKSDVCLDKQIDITKTFLDANFGVINQVFHQQQEKDSIFGRTAITKELYKIVDVYYQNLVYIKNEVLIYENDNSDDVHFQLQTDLNDKYLNCLYTQLLEGIHPCLESFFESDRDFIRKRAINTFHLNEELNNITKNSMAELRYCDEVDNFDIDLFARRRYFLSDKEYVNYFIYSDEISFDKLIILTNRVKSILTHEIFQELIRIADKKTVILIYDKNEFNSSGTINHFLPAAKTNKNMIIIPSENIDNSCIFFAPFLKFDVEECLMKAFNKYITYKVGIVDFNVTYEDDCLKNILSKYDIDALIQKQVNSKSQNNTRKKGNNKHK